MKLGDVTRYHGIKGKEDVPFHHTGGGKLVVDFICFEETTIDLTDAGGVVSLLCVLPQGFTRLDFSCPAGPIMITPGSAVNMFSTEMRDIHRHSDLPSITSVIPGRSRDSDMEAILAARQRSTERRFVQMQHSFEKQLGEMEERGEMGRNAVSETWRKKYEELRKTADSEAEPVVKKSKKGSEPKGSKEPAGEPDNPEKEGSGE